VTPSLYSNGATVDLPAEQRKVGTLPKGEYESAITGVAVVRRKDDQSHVLRVIVRTVRLQRDALIWEGLSSNPDDPFDLDEKQRRSLSRFADRLRIPGPATPQQVVDALVEMQRGGVVVNAKVAQTRVGQRTTLFANGHHVLPAPSTSVVVNEDEEREKAAAAHESHQRVLQGLSAARLGLTIAAQGCHELQESRGWASLGHETLNEYLASPEVTLSRPEFFRLAAIWRAYVLDGGVDPTRLRGAAETKLEVPLSALGKGLVTVEQAVEDATSMGRADLRIRYARIVNGDEGEAAAEDAESRRRDLARASVPVDVARRFVAVLLRIARYGYDEGAVELLRAALELAHEHALDVEEASA
jgi:hypothetical protein